MSVAWYIVLERKIPGLDHSVNGKALGRAAKVLDALAEEAGAQPLMDFFSASPEELAAFAEDQAMDLKEEATKLAPEKWFSANEGLKTVRALVRAVDNGKTEHAEAILDDLKEFNKVLEVAANNGVGWHLGIDF
jgi:hypothetical protein